MKVYTGHSWLRWFKGFDWILDSLGPIDLRPEWRRSNAE